MSRATLDGAPTIAWKPVEDITFTGTGRSGTTYSVRLIENGEGPPAWLLSIDGLDSLGFPDPGRARAAAEGLEAITLFIREEGDLLSTSQLAAASVTLDAELTSLRERMAEDEEFELLHESMRDVRRDLDAYLRTRGFHAAPASLH